MPCPRLIAFSFAALIAASTASGAETLPASYRSRLQKEFGCQGSDFDLIQCGRKAITARCQAWAGNYLQCPEGAEAAALARKCVGGSGVDAGIARALLGFDAAAAAAKRTKSCSKALGKAAEEMPHTYLANKCIAYDPASPRSTWLSQAKRNCENVGRTIEATRCNKKMDPKDKRAFEMSLQSARVGVDGCNAAVARGQSAAAGEWICKAANNGVHAKMVCDKSH